MRCRWLVAVFALHFLLSVGAFAFGKVAPHAVLPVAAQSLPADVATLAAADTSAPEGALSAAQLTDHALSDTQPDLPECLDVFIATSSRSAPLRAPSPPLAKDLTPPVLDGLQRPPRGASATA
ncbi:hypothetical protein [Hydrogenophaga sp.]|uniref:hypothetical protein n=1 Tax=Hydrogenophaga sp. TaxID=1904254 RepID=UPI002718F27E|nr:hypothetical protein [Hydrogenophaga sp.]MDO9436764.1 hypothetical protein [Hydrogenophaga sp.]